MPDQNLSATAAFEQTTAMYRDLAAAVPAVFKVMVEGGMERKEALQLTAQWAQYYWMGVFKEVVK